MFFVLCIYVFPYDLYIYMQLICICIYLLVHVVYLEEAGRDRIGA